MKLNQKAVNCFRVLSAEMIASAGKGNTKTCYNLAPMMFALFKDHYYYINGEENFNRDRLVICDAEISALYYSMLYSFGFGISTNDLKEYATERLPYFPNKNVTPGVDATTGSHAQSLSNAVGLAIAEISLASKFNAQKFNIISNYTYAFASAAMLEDGEAWESLGLAGELRLGNFILILSQEKSDTPWHLNLKKRFKSIGWNVMVVNNFNNYFYNSWLLTRAKLNLKPTVIIFKSNLTNPNEKICIKNPVLSVYEVEKMKADFGLNGSYFIPNDVRALCMRTERKLKIDYAKWQRKAVLYKTTHPKLSEELNEYFSKPKINFAKLIKNRPAKLTNLVEVSEEIINEVALQRHCLMGGSCDKKLFDDLLIQDNHNLSTVNYRGKNLWFGNKQRAMAGISAGISLYYDAPTYCSARIADAGVMSPGMALAQEMGLPVQYIFVKEEGESADLLYTIKNLNVYEPTSVTELLAVHNIIYNSEETAAIIISNKEVSGEVGDVAAARKLLTKK